MAPAPIDTSFNGLVGRVRPVPSRPSASGARSVADAEAAGAARSVGPTGTDDGRTDGRTRRRRTVVSTSMTAARSARGPPAAGTGLGRTGWHRRARCGVDDLSNDFLFAVASLTPSSSIAVRLLRDDVFYPPTTLHCYTARPPDPAPITSTSQHHQHRRNRSVITRPPALYVSK